MAKNYVLSKNVKKCVIFCFHQNNILWARLFQNICFLHDSDSFLVVLKVRLKDVEILFVLAIHFLIIMGFKI